jgi:hypothetical protein
MASLKTSFVIQSADRGAGAAERQSTCHGARGRGAGLVPPVALLSNTVGVFCPAWASTSLACSEPARPGDVQGQMVISFRVSL